jgi:hypothetical protein
MSTHRIERFWTEHKLRKWSEWKQCDKRVHIFVNGSSGLLLLKNSKDSLLTKTIQRLSSALNSGDNGIGKSAIKTAPDYFKLRAKKANMRWSASAVSLGR